MDEDIDVFLQVKDADLLHKILETTSTMIFWKDINRRFRGVNKAFLDYYGFASEEELIGKTDEDMGWHSDPDPFKNDELQVLHEGISTYRVHGRCIARGEQRDILASKSPIYDNGKIVGLVGAFEDVTDEYRWQRENSNFTRLLDNIPSGIAIYRKEGSDVICAYANQFFLDMLGLVDKYMLVGESYRNLTGVIHPDDLPDIRLYISAMLQGAQQQEGTFRYRRVGTTSYHWYHQVCRRVLLPHGDELFYVSYTDVDTEKLAGMALQKSQAIYEMAFKNSKSLLFEYNVDTHSVMIEPTASNLKLAESLGLPRSIENIPESRLDHIAEQSQSEYLRMHNDVQEGRSSSCEIWLAGQHRDLCIRISYTVISNEAQKTKSAFGIAKNITEEKIKEEQYKEFLNGGNGTLNDAWAYVRLNLTQNLCDECHTEQQTFNLSQDSNSADSFFDALCTHIVREADKKVFREKYNRIALMDAFVKGTTAMHLEHRFTLADGQEIWSKLYVNVVENPFNHNLEALLYAFNIDDEKTAQAIINELVGTDFSFVSLLDLNQGTVTEYGENGNSYSAKETLQNVDYTTAMITAVQAFVRDDCVEEAIVAHSIDTIKQNLSIMPIYRLSFPTKDGRVEGWRISYLGDSKSLVLIARSDITDTVRKELAQMAQLDEARMRAEKANEAKSAFLSNMSHDIRTPLNGVIGFTDLAIHETDLDKKQDYLRKIGTSGKLLLALVNDTLEISRIESGKMVLQFDETDSQEIGEHVIDALRPSADLKNIALIADISQFPQKTIWVDKLKVQKIILNLLSNAIKYTPPGGTVWINIQELVPPVQGCNRRIIVKDTGIGMKKDFIPLIFEPFTQERRPGMENVTGTGLGMSIVKRFVDLMKGNITVHSEENKGTEFIVDLPISRVREGKRVKRKFEQSQRSLAGKRVLLCEDNNLNAEIAQTLLKSKHMDVDLAVDGLAGLEKFQNCDIGTYDVILMDIRMPKLNGYETTQKIRRLDRPDAKTIPIIAMTADAFAEDIKAAQDVGMNGYITKPVEPDKLFVMLIEKMKS